MMSETIAQVRNGEIPPQRAPALVQLCKAQWQLIRARPKEDKLDSADKLSDAELLTILESLLRERFRPDELEAFAGRLSCQTATS